jgi:MFS family permease
LDNTPEDTTATEPVANKLETLRDRNFAFLWTSGLIATLGDSFTFVAFPWLVLQLSDSAVALGSVLAVEALPRAIFILVGGALTDRVSPRLVIIVTRLFYLILMTLLAFSVLSETIQLSLVFVFAFLAGTIGAFAIPAHSAILPQIISPKKLSFANSIMGGIGQISFLVGPALAGLLIVWLSGGETGSDPVGAQTDLKALGYIFSMNAAALLLAFVLTTLIRIDQARDVRDDKEESLLGSIKSGAVYLYRDRGLFLFTLYMGGIMFLSFGGVAVGIPMLASQQLPEGAAAYGLLISSSSAGAFVGILLAGLLPHPHPRYLGTTIFVMDLVLGPIFAMLGLIDKTMYGIVILFTFGLVIGYFQILLITWIQRRIPQQMLGRMMSMIMFATVGTAPLSGLLAGYVIELTNLAFLYMITGGLVTLAAFLCLLSPRMRGIGLPPNEQPTDDLVPVSRPGHIALASE